MQKELFVFALLSFFITLISLGAQIWDAQTQYILLSILVSVNPWETKLGSNQQEASPSAGKNTGVVLVSFSHTKVCTYSYFRWCGYFWGPWVSFVTTESSQ